MIIVMQPDATPAATAAVESKIRAHGLSVHVSRGTERTLIGAIGDERTLSPDMFETLPGVERALHIVKPYKVVAREWHRASTTIDVRGAVLGGDEVQMIAGPCSVETPEQMALAARAVAAEYIAAGGNHKIILCERGIRTFETAYRNVLDVTAIPVLKKETHLPVIVDPSHAGGKAWMVPSLACAALAAGADGLLVEIHPDPREAWCDADQALTPQEFAALMDRLEAVAHAVGRRLARSAVRREEPVAA